jgi:hypothetical protein
MAKAVRERLVLGSVMSVQHKHGERQAGPVGEWSIRKNRPAKPRPNEGSDTQRPVVDAEYVLDIDSEPPVSAPTLTTNDATLAAVIAEIVNHLER